MLALCPNSLIRMTIGIEGGKRGVFFYCAIFL